MIGLQPAVKVDLGRVAADRLAVRAEHLDLVAQLLDAAHRVPLVGVAGHGRSVFFSPDPPIMIGRCSWSGARQEDEILEPIPASGRRGHRLAVEQRAHGGDRLVHPGQPLAEARAEVDAVGGVLRLHPRAADAEDRPPAAEVVDRRDRLRHQPGVAERVRADQQAEAGVRRDLRPRRQRRVALEDRLQRVAEDRVQVVPGPQRFVAELVDADGRALEGWPVGRLAPEQDAETDVAHG